MITTVSQQEHFLTLKIVVDPSATICSCSPALENEWREMVSNMLVYDGLFPDRLHVD